MSTLRSTMFRAMRYHWIVLLLWLPGQAIFGTLIAQNGSFSILGNELFKLPESVPLDTLLSLHMLSGKILLGYGCFLVCLKIYLLAIGFRRTKKTVPNNLVRFSISNHYSYIMALILMQYLSMEYSWIFEMLLPQQIKDAGGSMDGLHKVGGWMLACSTLILALEKLYLVSIKPKTKGE